VLSASAELLDEGGANGRDDGWTIAEARFDRIGSLPSTVRLRTAGVDGRTTMTSRRQFPRSTIVASIAATALSATLSADEIVLVGGDVLRGTVVEESDASVVLDHPALGRIEVSRERIASVAVDAKPGGAAEASVDAADDAGGEEDDGDGSVPTAVLPAPEPPTPAKPDGSWKFNLQGSLTGSKNEAASTWNFRVAGGAKRESEEDRTTVTAEYYYATADGTNTDNNLRVVALEEWLFKDSRWEAFAQSIYQYDNFQPWEQRLGGYVGPAYRLVDGEKFKLKLRGGAGASYEFPDSEWTPELLAGYDLSWEIDDRQKLVNTFDIFPDVGEFGEFRFIVRVEYENLLDPDTNLSFMAGVRNEYDSYIAPLGDTSNDFKVYAGVKLAF
jgi:hypothetical protein